MLNRPNILRYSYSRSDATVITVIFVIALLILGCGSFSFRGSSSEVTAVEVARVSVGPQVSKVTLPQGAEVTFPAGALDDSTTLIIFQLRGKPASITKAGAKPVGDGYEITLSGGEQPSAPVEIRLPIQASRGVDPSYYTVYRSDIGTDWVDIGGVIEANQIIAWTDHFTSFWPAQAPAPERPIRFINHGQYDARIVVDTYTPDPNFPPGAMPGGVAVSFAPTSPGYNTTNALLLPVGRYIFCYDWFYAAGQQHHVLTGLEGLSDSDPRYIEGARSVIITPGRESRWFEGACPGIQVPSAGPAPVSPGFRTVTPTINRTTLLAIPPSRTPTRTVSIHPPGGIYTITPTPTWTRTRTPTSKTGIGIWTPTKTKVNYLPYYNAWIKRCDDLRNEFVQKNCSPPPGYSGCAMDVFGMPTPIRTYLYTDYSVNLHSSYVTFAKSLEDQLLAGLRQCFQEFLDNRTKIPNLDARKAVQSQCINDKVGKLWDVESRRIHETSCRAMCGEMGKIGVVEGVPAACVCK